MAGASILHDSYESDYDRKCESITIPYIKFPNYDKLNEYQFACLCVHLLCKHGFMYTFINNKKSLNDDFINHKIMEYASLFINRKYRKMCDTDLVYLSCMSHIPNIQNIILKYICMTSEKIVQIPDNVHTSQQKLPKDRQPGDAPSLKCHSKINRSVDFYDDTPSNIYRPSFLLSDTKESKRLEQNYSDLDEFIYVDDENFDLL